MNTILEKIINIIYPQRCSICEKLEKKSLCNKCKQKLKEEFCFSFDDYMNDSNKYFIIHYYFFRYKNIIRKQILGLKFNEKPYICQTITYFLKNMQKSFENLKKYDIIIVVPISKQRRKERGYNQSELIGKQIAVMINAKIEKNILTKKRNTVPQSTLNKKQREENVKRVYQVKKIQKIQNKKISLIDDIYTTGSTVNECAKVLVEGGIKRENISVLTLIKD